MLKLRLEVDKLLSYQANLRTSTHGKYFTKRYIIMRNEISKQIHEQIKNSDQLIIENAFGDKIEPKFKDKKLVVNCNFIFKYGTKPKLDLDNAFKMVGDVLETTGVIDNDNNIYELHLKKLFNQDKKYKKIIIEIDIESL